MEQLPVNKQERIAVLKHLKVLAIFHPHSCSSCPGVSIVCGNMVVVKEPKDVVTMLCCSLQTILLTDKTTYRKEAANKLIQVSYR